MNYMLMPLRRYADFNGRSRRKEFWLWQLLNLLVAGLLATVMIVMVTSALREVDERGGVTSYEYDSRYDRDRDRDRDGDYARDRDYNDRDSYRDDDRRSRADDEETNSSDDAGYDYRSYSSGASYSFGGGYDVDPQMMMEELGAGFWIVFGLWMLWSLFALIPNLAVTIRRLHDTDKSGWMILLGLIPLVGAIILLVFYLSEGTRGPNRFGPDPKGGDYDQTFR